MKNKYKLGGKNAVKFYQVHCDWCQEKKTAQEPCRWEEAKEEGILEVVQNILARPVKNKLQDPLRILI